MDYIFDDWNKLLSAFQNSVSKDLKEIHRCKADIQQMKTDIFNRIEKGKFYRDENRIVISAPEIVIGNVDSSGDLKPEGGIVVVKGAKVALNGVGSEGSIESKANTISQRACDPGSDGLESVVYPSSSVVTQARNITLQSNDAKDCFSQQPLFAAGSGILIVALQCDVASLRNDRG